MNMMSRHMTGNESYRKITHQYIVNNQSDTNKDHTDKDKLLKKGNQMNNQTNVRAHRIIYD